MEDRGIHHSGHISGVGRGAGHARVCGEANLQGTGSLARGLRTLLSISGTEVGWARASLPPGQWQGGDRAGARVDMSEGEGGANGRQGRAEGHLLEVTWLHVAYS